VKNIIQIFDSLSHPVLGTDLRRISCSDDLGIKDLLEEMDCNNIYKTLFTWNKQLNTRDQVKFINIVSQFQDKLVPVLLFPLKDLDSVADVSSSLKKIKLLGYKGIKLHARISGFSLDNPVLVSAIKEANNLNLAVLLCTYFYDKSVYTKNNSIESLSELLYNLDGSRLILMHGGSVRLMETIEIVRAFNNALLDLSFTICKYEGSSLDADIQFAFSHFDKRICIGSDYPEFSLTKFRKRFDLFSKKLSIEKSENIAFKNLSHFLRLE
jgi:predicted TIM-barrel fold metal-dependent hydrolase